MIVLGEVPGIMQTRKETGIGTLTPPYKTIHEEKETRSRQQPRDKTKCKGKGTRKKTSTGDQTPTNRYRTRKSRIHTKRHLNV